MNEIKSLILNTNVNIIFKNYIVPNPQQLTNMYGTLKAILERIKRDCEDQEKILFLNKKINLIELMNYQPIPYILKNTKLTEHLDTKEARALPKNISLAMLEWILFRQISIKTKLNAEYLAAKDWRSGANRITFSAILMIATQIKTDFYMLLDELLDSFDFGDLNIVLPELNFNDFKGDGVFKSGKNNY